VAIVTGGGQGIGRGIAVTLARRGAHVVVNGRTETKLLALCDEISAFGGRAIAVVADVSRREDVDRTVGAAVSRFGRIDILVNNAQATTIGVGVADLSEDDVEIAFRSGAMGTLYAMQACYPHLRAAGGGCIINFGSSTAVAGDTGFGAYAMAKEAIRGLSRVAAKEWGADNIRVNVVCPVATSPASEAFASSDPVRFGRVVRSIPLGRFGRPSEDIGALVAAVVSDDMSYLTGATLMADGGRTFIT